MGTSSETWVLAHDTAPYVRWIRLDEIARIEIITWNEGRSEIRSYAADESIATLGYFNTREAAREWIDETMRAAVSAATIEPPPYPGRPVRQS